MILAAARAGMDPEIAERVDGAIARVKARVEAGEDFDKVTEEEAERAGLTPDFGYRVPVAKAKADDTAKGDIDALYL
jgi:hypothetical protein